MSNSDLNENAEIRARFSEPPYRSEEYIINEKYEEEKKQEIQKGNSLTQKDAVFVDNKYLQSLNIKSVVGAYPIEPIMLVVSIPGNGFGIDSFSGIPGFYDNHQKKFILLSGEPVSEEINKMVQEYISASKKSDDLMFGKQ